jgi:hypothetical protein
MSRSTYSSGEKLRMSDTLAAEGAAKATARKGRFMRV